MSKEYLEALEKLDHTLCLNNNEGYLKFCVSDIDCQSVGEMVRCLNKVESALHRLESIDTAEPSEALNGLEQFINEMTRCLENPKEYVKGYEKQIFWKYKNTLETTIKQALLKVQESKKYLTWEDLEFTEENQTMEVLLNGVTYNICFYEFTIVGQNEVNIYTNGTHIVTLNSYYPEDIQFFNNLHLEVKE